MLRAVRQRFDDTPDTGLIGKSIQSFFLGIYLSVKRTIGSVIIVMFMMCGTALATVLSLLMLMLAPVFAIIMTSAMMLFNLIIFDTAMAAACRRASCGDEDMPSSVSPLVKILISTPLHNTLPLCYSGNFVSCTTCSGAPNHRYHCNILGNPSILCCTKPAGFLHMALYSLVFTYSCFRFISSLAYTWSRCIINTVLLLACRSCQGRSAAHLGQVSSSCTF